MDTQDGANLKEGSRICKGSIVQAIVSNTPYQQRGIILEGNKPFLDRGMAHPPVNQYHRAFSDSYSNFQMG